MIRAISVKWFGSVRISTRARLTKTVTIWAEEDIDAGAAIHLLGALDQGDLFAFLCQESR